MLLRNLSLKQGLLNGTLSVVKPLQTNFIGAEIITGSNKGERVFIPRIILQPSVSTLHLKMQRRQFPINLAFAMTINKSQGQSFYRVGVYLPEPVFAHGQLYVALTRGRNHKNLKVHIKETFNQGKLMGDQRIFTKNLVTKEIYNK
jgi:ATP-dependent DNA helicase PIF1